MGNVSPDVLAFSSSAQWVVNMFTKIWNWLVYNKALALLIVFVVAATVTLTVWQYRSIANARGAALPLSTQGNQGQISQMNTDPQTTTSSSGQEGEDVPIRLSEGQAQAVQVTPMPVAPGEPLSPEAIDAVIARLPTLPAQPDDTLDFQLAGDPIPPPRPGTTVEEAFPPAAQAPGAEVVEEGPLEVLRFAPEGEIPVAPFINLTFNQPMVALGTLSDLAEADVPVRIEPDLPGTWRWLGTRTLNFQYDSALIDRLPKATVYRVTVPAGTTSAVGGRLAETVEWSFTTPPPKVTFSYPGMGEPQSREPLFFIHFDHRIDPAAVLESISVRAGATTASLQLVQAEDIEADEKLKWLLKDAVEGRWLAFRAQEPLPADSEVTVQVGPETPSAEGPLTTTEAQQYSFRTYAPLRVEDHGCAWGNRECPPLTPFFIRFNNPIDTAAYDPSMLRIDPPLPGASINVFGNNIQIQGASQGQTTYTVRIDASLRDIFGQELGRDVNLSFRVGRAEPMLQGTNEQFITLDPAAERPQFSVYSINYSSLDVEIYAVQPNDWPAFQEYMRNYQRTDRQLAVPGRLVKRESMRIEAATDALTEVSIDLSAHMDGPSGHFIVIVRPPANMFSDKNDIYWRTVQSWVQVTKIGLDAYNDHSEMVVWATNLLDGAPLGGVTVTANPGGYEAVTQADGTARFGIPNGAKYLVARQGADSALLPRSSYIWGDDSWSPRPLQDELRWYVFDDRQMYRPGEEVHLKGWLRKIGAGQTGDVGLVGSSLTGVNYQITDAQGNEIGSGTAEVNALGGFDFVYQIPAEVNLGYAQVYFWPIASASAFGDRTYSHAFQIQEFRRPEFEVTARNETPGPYFAGEHAVVAAQAQYYAGGALPNAPVTWQVTSSPSHYAPPNWPDFVFGTWTPWWWRSGGAFFGRGPFDPYGPDTRIETFTGTTDAAGEHYLRLDFGQEAEPKPISVIAQATVEDVNRQAWSGSTSLLVHPASLYVGMRSERYFVERGTPLEIDFIVTDLDGTPVADRPVEMRAARLEWNYRDGSWQEEEADVQTCTSGSREEPVTCTFETPLGGSYRITARVTDGMGRVNQSQMTRWVSGGKQPPAREIEQEQVTLIPDKESYQAGDTAQILVQPPFSPAEGLLTVNRDGLVYTERFSIEDSTYTLSIPIEEAHVPNLHIQVDVNGAAPRTGDQGEELPGVPPRPAFASGTLNLPVPPAQRTLALTVTPEQTELEPGGETTLDLRLVDATGAPVANAELAVVVVDEAILGLTGYQMADPLETFYSERQMDWMSIYARSSIVLANPMVFDQGAGGRAMATQAVMDKGEMDGAIEAPAAAAPEEAMEESARDMATGAQTQEPIRMRIDFNPLAVFAPGVRTDADGTAQVTVKLPDNLTRYRVMVAAVDGSGRQFGTGEANMTARLPLMIRPSAPRFLNFGDQFELPVVLQNQTDNPLAVDVVVRASNLRLTDGAEPDAAGISQTGKRVTVPARDRIEVRFPAAAEMAGTTRIQVAVTTEGFADAAVIDLPVYTPATTEAFATYGVIDQGAAAQPLMTPSGVFPQYGGLEISTSSTALHALTDAVLYLVTYPYDCVEQLSSRILAVAALRDVLTAFQAEGLPSAAEMQAAVDRDIAMLQGLQNEDGGFPYWRRGFESIPFNTIHTAHALYRAQSKDFAVPAEMQARALDYLRAIENHYPHWYSQETRRTLSAYALYTRNLMGDRDAAKAVRLIDEAGLENLSLDAIGWLWPVLQDAPEAENRLEEIRRLVENRAVETAGAANFTTDYDDQNYLLLGSNRRTDAILLDALMIDNPQHDLIPKLVNGLLAHRTKGRWMNTQENVFVLLSLDRYFNTFESQTPDFVASIWLGDTYAGSHEFRGRSTERSETALPMSYLMDAAAGETQDLILSKDGPGRLYYRLGLRYAPDSLKMDALDMGFVVRRVYEAVDDPDDVQQDADGTWRIKAGATVRVHLTMVADNRRYHVALVDPLPAGLESVNPALAVSTVQAPNPTDAEARSWWWWGPWYQHQNLRDERAEAFTPLLWDGVYEYSYTTRATTPGRFIVPPAKAEEMYSPEVFGRSGSDVVIVE